MSKNNETGGKDETNARDILTFKIINDYPVTRSSREGGYIDYHALQLTFESFADGKYEFNKGILEKLGKDIKSAPYLDHYIDKILKDNAGDKDFIKKIEDTTFEHGYLYKISIKDYQTISKDIANNKNLVMHSCSDSRKFEYIFKMAKETESSAYVADLATEVMKGGNKIISPTEKARVILNSFNDKKGEENEKEGERILAQAISRAGLTKKDFPQAYPTYAARQESENIQKIIDNNKVYTDGLNSKKTEVKIYMIEELINTGSTYKINLAADIVQQASGGQKKDLLVAFAKSADALCDYTYLDPHRISAWNNPVTGEGSKDAFHKLKEMISQDRNLAAEVIIETTTGKNSGKVDLARFNKLYNETVRGIESPVKAPVKLPELDKMMERMSPRDFGRLLFEEGRVKAHPKLSGELQKEDNNLEGLEQFKKSARVLQENIRGNRGNNLDAKQLDAAAESLKTNLTREQMAFVVESVKQFEAFDKKNYFSKLVIRFVDAISRSRALDNPIVAKAVNELVTKGANITTKVPDIKTEKRSSLVQTAKEGKKGYSMG